MEDKQLELYRAYNTLFNSPEGEMVLKDLNLLITNAKNEKDMQEMFRKQWLNNGVNKVLNTINSKKDFLSKKTK